MSGSAGPSSSSTWRRSSDPARALGLAVVLGVFAGVSAKAAAESGLRAAAVRAGAFFAVTTPAHYAFAAGAAGIVLG